jgi:polar amino acid transport system substrate-binding protein
MRRVLLTCAVLGVFVAGCASTSDQAQKASIAALATTVPVTTTSTTTTPVPPCDPKASLAPAGALPAPGRMPAGSFMATIRSRGKLIAGVDQNTLLLSYLNPADGQIEGFEDDLLRQVAQAIFGDPNAIVTKALTTAERLDAVHDGSVDIVADAVTMTCMRKEKVDFSSVYYDASQRVMVPADSPATSVHDLGGKRVCATIGSTTLTTIEAQRPAVVPDPVPQRTDCLVALQQGTADAISSDDAILLGFKAQDSHNVKIIGPSLADEPYGMAISKAHPEFVRFVNAVLDKLRSDGTWQRIYEKWFGKYVSGPTPAPPAPDYSQG